MRLVPGATAVGPGVGGWGTRTSGLAVAGSRGGPWQGLPSCGSRGWLLRSVPCCSHRWRGDYGGKKQLWFPSNYVEEMVSPAALEPEREVSAEPCGGDTPVTHSDTATVTCSPLPPLRGPSFQDTRAVCVVCACGVCLLRAHRAPHPRMCTADVLTHLWALLSTALGREQPPGGLAPGGLGCAGLSDR